MNIDTPAPTGARDPWRCVLTGGFVFFGGFLLAWVAVIRGNYPDYVMPLALLFATLYLQRTGRTVREFWSTTPRPFAVAMLGFAVLSVIAAFRTVPFSGSIGELRPYVFAPVFSLAILALTFFCDLKDRRLIDWTLRALFWGWVVGVLLLGAEFAAQLLSTFINSIGDPNGVKSSDFNRSVFILAVLSWLAVPSLRPRLGAIWAVLPVGLIWLLSLASQSQVNQIGLPIAMLAYLAALWRPTLTCNALAGGAAALLVTAPFAYQLLFRIAPGIAGLNENLFLIRAEIWDGAARLALKAPVFGHGFYAAKKTGKAFMEHIYFLPDTVGHPHNAFLEVWTDLGLVGVVFGLVLLFALWRGLRGLSPGVLPAAIGATTIVLLVLLISHSIWSTWLIGFLAFFAGFVRLLDQSLGESCDTGASSS